MTIKPSKPSMRLKYLGIDTYKHPVIFMRNDCHVCLSEGFEAHTRIRIDFGDKWILTTLNTVASDLLEPGTAALSEYALNLLGAKEGEEIYLSHPRQLHSLSHVRSKIYGNSLDKEALGEIIKDISSGRFSDIHIASFVTACAGGRLSEEEIVNLTKAMIDTGDRLNWASDIVVDKHCVGGLPGNRTTPIVVPIVSEFGLTMPKTSSRAITSPAGTADTMEVLAPVDLDIASMQKVVEKEGACIVWGGSVDLSPADDILIRVEKALDLDSEGQLIASVLSKKISAGSTHVVIDIPIGITAKVRSEEMAILLKEHLELVSKSLDIELKVVFTDGSRPVGCGIGPALEARDVLSVLRSEETAPKDLRDRALLLAGNILEFSPKVAEGKGLEVATEILDSGRAWKKFQAICEAQGGMREIPVTSHTHPYLADKDGIVGAIDNRRIALIAKLAGAPEDKVAGVDLHVGVGTKVQKGQPLFTIYAKNLGKLQYVLDFVSEGNSFLEIEEF